METCGQRIWTHGEERRCLQTIGLTKWYDSSGVEHAACRNHVASMQHRWTPADPPEPVWLGPDLTTYESWTDAGWTEAELREAFGA
jgi:hypothetical protein